MKFVTAIGVSIALHGVLAAGLVAYMKLAPGPTTLATLDLSSVDLSFAADEDESAAVAPSSPEPPPPEPPVPPEESAPDPALDRPDDPLPPDPAAPRLPEPEPERPVMETPDIPSEVPPKDVEKPAAEPPSEPPPPVPAVAPRQAKVDAPPKPRKAIRPDYPKGARQRGEQGDVVVEIRVNAEGAVDGVVVVSSCGFPELDDAAVRAVRAARFTPAKSGRDSVASTARLTLTFRLK